MNTRAAEQLGRPELGPLVDALARRFGDGAAPVAVSLEHVPDATWLAVADLLGVDRVPRREKRLPVDRVLGALGLASVDDLRAVVEVLRGPLPNRRAERDARRAVRASLWSWLTEQTATIELAPGRSLAAWVDTQRALGVRGGVDVHRRRLERCVEVLRALPAEGTSLAALAADHTGDPHALDHGRSLAAMVLDAIAITAGVPRPTDAEAARLLWESVGVVPDPLSSTAVVLGLPGEGDSPLGGWLSAAQAVHEPVVLSLANLRRWPRPPLPAQDSAYVFENPSLLAEAAAGNWSGPPLVCSSGRPSVAVVVLLRQLGAAGACLYQHADFDAAGLAISGWLAERAGTTPWRMRAHDYLSALEGVVDAPSLDSEVAVPSTPWDPNLHEAMNRRRQVVFEEVLRARLLDAAYAE